MNQQPNQLLLRLTALWALSESGLGGLMHAFKIPFTGFFLGGFAIVIITLIAHHSPSKWKSIMQATLLVVLIKAAASPHSPPMAYIAVGFQGLAGALVYSIIPVFRLAAPLFGIIALFESAVQKFLVMTLIFGRSVWEALDAFFQGIVKDLAIDPDFSFSFWLIACYVTGYSLWGLLLGWWASSLPVQLQQNAEPILSRYQQLQPSETQPGLKKRNKRNRKLIATFFVMIFIASTFLLQGSGNKALYAIARTLGALLVLFYIINPLVKWGMKKWLAKEQSKNQNRISTLMDTLPELKNYVEPAMRMAREQHRGLSVYKVFVVNLLVLSLYNTNLE